MFCAFALILIGCKVPLTDLTPIPVIADAVWFAEEETLFVFYEIEAEQGVTEDSVIEIRFITDDGEQDWTPLLDLPQVHPTVPGACIDDAICGVASLHVPEEPRHVEMRLRYHPDGELTLDIPPWLNVIDVGPPHSHRSLIIYGVFDEENVAVQWRSRHHFPNLRNMEVERLGLRRPFEITDMAYGGVRLPDDNDYGYGVACGRSTPLGFEAVGTQERAVFHPEDLPPSASTSRAACAMSHVPVPVGVFSTPAVALKNPEVRPAFPALRSPIRDATPIKYVLSLCERGISGAHLKMVRQRLLAGDVDTLCIDGWVHDDLEERLVAQMWADIEGARAEGNDMVLVVGIHHDDRALRARIEAVFAEILPLERARSTPRVAGAFVLDSYTHQVQDTRVGAVTIWCPMALPEDEDAAAAMLASSASLVCAIIPQNISLGIGPLSLSALPILPTRQMYLNFIDQYSEDTAGRILKLNFRAPQLTPFVEHIDAPPFGSVTFFNDEIITASGTDAFSYCPNNDEYAGFVFRSRIVGMPLPLDMLPELHATLSEPSYELGIIWDFPYLLRVEYEAVLATALSAFSFSLPLGIGAEVEQDYGSSLWGAEIFPLEKTLLQCRRFCTHPTFDAAGVYQVDDPFDVAYRNACYVPDYPERGDSGAPFDP